MTKFEVVESKNWKWHADLSKGRIRYRGKTLIPVEVQSILDGGISGGQAIGGAIAGAVLLGGVGALAGGAFGAARGKVTCLVTVASGERLLCQTSRGDFPLFHRQLLEAIEAVPHQFKSMSARFESLESEVQPGFTVAQFLLGPFYLLRFGFWRFLVAAIATVFSYGVAWIFMPLWSRALLRTHSVKERKRLSAELLQLRSLSAKALI